MNVTRQLSMTIAAAGAVGVAAVAALSIQFWRSSSSARELTARVLVHDSAMFALADSLTGVQGVVQQIVREKDADNLEKLIARLEELEKNAWARVEEAGGREGALGQGLKTLIAKNRAVLETLLKGEYAVAQQMYIEEVFPAFRGLLAELGGAARELRGASEREAQKAAAGDRRAGIVILLLVAAGLALSGSLSAAVLRRIRRNLDRSASELALSADQIAGAAAQVSNASQSLARTTSEQAAALTETGASSRQINAATQENAGNSKTAAALMEEVSSVVADANRRLDGMSASMNAIATSSEKISRILKVIDEIAFQTNILALNAAVEAARAGEAGMGFAVVADEVRSLAQRCAQAAQDTTGLVEESRGRSTHGSASLQDLVQSFASITERTARARTLVDGVSRASQQQAAGTIQVEKAIAEVEQLTQTAAANAEENAAAGEELSAQAAALREVVARLEALVGISR
jgi:methyl-accepting chemotaxis protein